MIYFFVFENNAKEVKISLDHHPSIGVLVIFKFDHFYFQDFPYSNLREL